MTQQEFDDKIDALTTQVAKIGIAFTAMLVAVIVALSNWSR